MIKKLFILLLLLPCFVHAQYSIGYNKSGRPRKISKIKDEKLALLKSTTTAFVIPLRDSNSKAQYEQAIKSVWTLTPFEIIYPNDINRYSNKKNYSIFKLRTYTSTKQIRNKYGASIGNGASALYLAYELWIPDAKKKDQIKSHIIAAVELYPESELIKDFFKKRDGKKEEIEKDLTNMAYKTATIYNWGPGFLKGYLKTINDNLINNKVRDAGIENTEKNRLSSLKHDTLFVPQYVLTKYNKYTINEHDDDLDDDDLTSAYPFPVKFLSREELNNRILDATHPIKYLVYCKSNAEKYVHIYDSNDGQLIFARGSFLSYNFKYKDLRKLAKEIE